MHRQSLNENLPPKHQVSSVGGCFLLQLMAGGVSGLAKLVA